MIAFVATAPVRAEEPPLKGAFGEVFALADEPYPAPQTAFQTRDGETVTLADFKGRVVLLNFWATWCAPCVEEMPTLDALQAD
ncbi:TlpA family protein disulfide reductase, partial [Tritonibacter sp. SIMBA_163]|uniref:TlpA family protein disulfide reductase n=1 Tax=Tritonibacter sp. SIMBA_163 TaxID=3080868 RepID=UPI00397F3055